MTIHWLNNWKKGASGLAALTMLGLSACNGTGSVPASLIGISEPKPDPTESPAPGVITSELYTGPAEVEPYVAKFVADARIRGVDVTPEMSSPKLTIRIASLDSYGGSVIGLCETSSSLRRVTFDPDFWNSVSEAQRELLAHHEFGHCVLYRGHRTSVLESGIYASLMYPTIMRSSSYLDNYEYYQNELFTYSALEASPDADPTLITTHVCDDRELGLHQERGE